MKNAVLCTKLAARNDRLQNCEMHPFVGDFGGFQKIVIMQVRLTALQAVFVEDALDIFGNGASLVLGFVQNGGIVDCDMAKVCFGSKLTFEFEQLIVCDLNGFLHERFYFWLITLTIIIIS